MVAWRDKDYKESYFREMSSIAAAYERVAPAPLLGNTVDLALTVHMWESHADLEDVKTQELPPPLVRRCKG